MDEQQKQLRACVLNELWHELHQGKEMTKQERTWLARLIEVGVEYDEKMKDAKEEDRLNKESRRLRSQLGLTARSPVKENLKGLRVQVRICTCCKKRFTTLMRVDKKIRRNICDDCVQEHAKQYSKRHYLKKKDVVRNVG